MFPGINWCRQEARYQGRIHRRFSIGVGNGFHHKRKVSRCRRVELADGAEIVSKDAGLSTAAAALQPWFLHSAVGADSIARALYRRLQLID